MSTTDREVPSPHPAHVRNNRILIEYKQSGERQQEKVAHGNMEEALCKPPVQSSCRSVRIFPSPLFLSSLSLSLSLSLLSLSLSLSTLLRLFFLGRASPFLSTLMILPPEDLQYSTYVGDISRPVLYGVHKFWRINLHVHTHTYASTHAHIGPAVAPDVARRTRTFPDWRFSYLIVDCHAKTRTSYWLGVLPLHPLVLGARVCLSVLERRGNKHGESYVRAHDCVRVRRRAVGKGMRRMPGQI